MSYCPRGLPDAAGGHEGRILPHHIRTAPGPGEPHRIHGAREGPDVAFDVANPRAFHEVPGLRLFVEEWRAAGEAGALIPPPRFLFGFHPQVVYLLDGAR
jgi:hypothetical protein